MSETRIYRVDEKDAHGKVVATFLIRAPNVAQAVRYITYPRFTGDVASQDDLVELASKGVKVQVANGDGSR